MLFLLKTTAQNSKKPRHGGAFCLFLACQDLGGFLGGNLLHRLAAALDAAILARAIDQNLDHSTALFAKNDLIHTHTSLFVESFE